MPSVKTKHALFHVRFIATFAMVAAMLGVALVLAGLFSPLTNEVPRDKTPWLGIVVMAPLCAAPLACLITVIISWRMPGPQLWLRALAWCFYGVVALFLSIFGSGALSEGFFPWKPYVDTEFAERYSTERYSEIENGMTADHILEFIGSPLSVSSNAAETVWYYSDDGACPWGDFAWFCVSVVLQRGMIVRKEASWVFD